MSQFYQVDPTKLSLNEYSASNPSALIILGWPFKSLRQSVSISLEEPNCDSTLPFIAAELPLEIQSIFSPLNQQLAQLGFSSPLFHIIYDAGSSTTWYWATFLHSSGQHFARIHHRVWGPSTTAKPVLVPMFITRFADGTFLVSSTAKPALGPHTVQRISKPGMKIPPLWAAHENRAEQLAQQKAVQPVTTHDELIVACEALHILWRDFHLASGVFRPRTDAEMQKAQQTAARVEELRTGGYENADVMLELERLQDKKTSRQMMFWILLGSLVGFFALGARWWNWKFTLWLIPVLLFHEAGHWVTMRLFKYRNLRMFFIPLFGAAVVGRHWNVPGWKKALVSLAGPLPGIVVGLGLGIASIALHNSWMNKAALMLLLLNGMNLLPIFPMDGGHVLQHTIFCRNRWLEAVFRLLAIGALLLLGIGGRAFLYLGIALGVSLPITFKLAKVKEDLSKVDLPQPSPADDRIPIPTANAIIKAVKAALGPKIRPSNKVLAQHSLSVFESLNAKPPGVLATLGLLAVQGAGLFIAVVMGLLLFFAGQVELKEFARAAARQPHYSVTCGTIQTSGADLVRPGHLIVTTFNKEEKAAAAFKELKNTIPPDSGLILYGQSVLLSIPAGDESLRDKWFDTLQERSTNLFVRVSNAPVSLAMTFLAFNNIAASNITQELGEYFHASVGMHLVPPWSPEAHGPKYAQFRKARAGWQRIHNVFYTNSDHKAYSDKITAAVKRGALGEVKRLQEEQGRKTRELRAEALQKLTHSPGMDPELARLFGALEDLSYTNRIERQKLYREVAAKLGEVRYLDDKPDPQANAHSASGGTIAMHGLLCELRWANFMDPQGLVSFTKWLCDKGCLQLKYDLQGGWIGLEELDEDLEGR